MDLATGFGAAAPLLRRAWELGADDGLKRELIEYNMDDCRAAAKVADAGGACAATGSGLDAVDISSLEVDFQRTFGKFDSALPEFEKINNAAYWDYQRSKVYARTDKTIRRTVHSPKAEAKARPWNGSDGRRRPRNVPKVPCGKILDLPRRIAHRLTI